MKSINLFGLILDETCSLQHYTYCLNNCTIYAYEGFLKYNINVYVKASPNFILETIYISKDTLLNIQDTFDSDSVIILKNLLIFCKRHNQVSLQEKLLKYEILL
jgi:hypothetical protein